MALYLNDKTANANHLTDNGSVTEVTTGLPFAQSTACADFEASSSQYLRADDSASLSISSTFTIELWVNFESTPSSGSAMALVGKWENATDQDYHLWLYNDGGTLKVQGQISQNGNGTYDGYRWNWTPSTSTWYHLALTCNAGNASASTFELFIDGSSQGNGTGFNTGDAVSIHNGNSHLFIGSDAGGSFFDGKMDDVRIWNTVRTGTEITNNKDKELNGSESGLVAYYPFEIEVTSPSRSASASTSPSASQSPSSSASASASSSASRSASASASSSTSPSPSSGYTGYTRGNYAVIPTNDDDLETAYSAQDVTDVSADDAVRVGQTGAGEYMLHQFKNFLGIYDACIVTWNGQSSLAPTTSEVFLQIYNRNTATWDTLTSNISESANTDFTLSSAVPNLANYKDTRNVISCRVYQLAT